MFSRRGLDAGRQVPLHGRQLRLDKLPGVGQAGSPFKLGGDLRDPLDGGGGHASDAGNCPDPVLDRAGDEQFHVLGGRAGIVGNDVHHRHVQPGKQTHRQMQQGEDPAPGGDHDKENDRDRIGDGQLEELASHALIPHLELLVELSVEKLVSAPGRPRTDPASSPERTSTQPSCSIPVWMPSRS